MYARSPITDDIKTVVVFNSVFILINGCKCKVFDKKCAQFFAKEGKFYKCLSKKPQ